MRQRKGFTLVELIVSIGLVALLMVGVSSVFRTISSTVSAGSAISDNTRIARGAQAVFTRDMGHAVTNKAPAMLLYSRTRAAFRNAVDQASDTDGNPSTIDLNGNNVEGEAAIAGEVISPATYNHRNHRIDIFSFFVRDLSRRQTGGSEASSGQSPIIADMSSAEAWVWYGHLRVNAQGTFTTAQDPGQGDKVSNPDNFYASKWILGREQILLREPIQEPTDTTPKIRDRAKVPQIYNQVTTGINKSPLSYSSNANVGTSELRESRYDLAGTTVDGYRQRIADFRKRTGALVTDNWWGDVFCSDGRRFQANPYVGKPLTSAIVSQQSPIFVFGCTQFIVEYAGDFLVQNNDPTSPLWGQVTDVYTNKGGDGQVDYIVTGVAPNRHKQIRWYGAPRDVNGDGKILVNQPPTPNDANQLSDVVPLRDVWRLSTTPGASPNQTHAPFEKFTYTGLDARGTSSLKDFLAAAGDYTAPNGMTANDFYTCAWGDEDPKPKMVRITMTIDDPQGRNPNPDGQTFEYIFELQ